MKLSRTARRRLFTLARYMIFFTASAFIVTCCILLFLRYMELDEETVRRNAPATFFNIIFLSLIFTAIYEIYRKFTVERPVKRILKAAEQITAGDFSVRIEPLYGDDSINEFDTIIAGFNKMAEELSGIETLRTDFIANVSHELKTPLAVMQNYGMLLQLPELSDEQRMEYAKAITNASRRLAELITNILRLNKLENQQIFLFSEKYDLGEQLIECLLSFENELDKKELELRTDIENGIIINADPELLSLVWNNLLSNAIKFTPEKGTISVSLRQDGKYALVHVQDTGCGMSPEVGAHIFEKFYQGDTSHASKGNGLGLALVKRVIDITRSEISVESEPGKGSIFCVKIQL